MRSCEGCLRQFVCLCRWEEALATARNEALQLNHRHRHDATPDDHSDFHSSHSRETDAPCQTLVNDPALLARALRVVLVYFVLRVLGVLPPLSVVEAVGAIILLVDGCPLQRVQIAIESVVYALVLQCLPIPTSWYTLATLTLLGCVLMCGGVVCPRSTSKHWSALSITTWWAVTLVTLLILCGGAPAGLISPSLRSVERFLSTLSLCSAAVVATDFGDMPRCKYLRAAFLSHVATWLVVHTGLIFSLVDEPAALVPQHVCFAVYTLALAVLHFWAASPVFVLAIVGMECPLVASLWTLMHGMGSASGPDYSSPSTLDAPGDAASSNGNYNNSSRGGRGVSRWFPWVSFPCDTLVRRYVVHVAQPLWTCCLPSWAVAGPERRFAVALALYVAAKLVVVLVVVSNFDGSFLFFANVASVVAVLGCLLSHQQLSAVFVALVVVGVTLLFALLSAFNVEYLQQARLVSAWGLVSGALTLVLLWTGNGSALFAQSQKESASPRRGAPTPSGSPGGGAGRGTPAPRRRRPR